MLDWPLGGGFAEHGAEAFSCAKAGAGHGVGFGEDGAAVLAAEAPLVDDEPHGFSVLEHVALSLDAAVVDNARHLSAAAAGHLRSGEFDVQFDAVGSHLTREHP